MPRFEWEGLARTQARLVGRRILGERKKRGWSRADMRHRLARVGAGVQYTGAWMQNVEMPGERGWHLKHPPWPERLDGLSRAFGINPAILRLLAGYLPVSVYRALLVNPRYAVQAFVDAVKVAFPRKFSWHEDETEEDRERQATFEEWAEKEVERIDGEGESEGVADGTGDEPPGGGGGGGGDAASGVRVGEGPGVDEKGAGGKISERDGDRDA